jgi:hypothetical protein
VWAAKYLYKPARAPLKAIVALSVLGNSRRLPTRQRFPERLGGLIAKPGAALAVVATDHTSKKHNPEAAELLQAMATPYPPPSVPPRCDGHLRVVK